MAQSGIEYHVRAVLETQRAAGAIGKERKWAQGIALAGSRMQGLGKSIMGTSLATAAMFGKATTAAAGLAGAYGFGRLITSAVAFNAQLEQSRFSIAATLQLMGHVGGDFQRNLKISEALSDRIFKMAATSPASFKQAQTMFENMLPGARSVTGNMEDILSLTKQSLSLGIIMGGDFVTTGAQLSRILTGAAGAEFQTWKVLQTPILEAGKAVGIFNKSMVISQKLTEEFNKLSPQERFDLVTEATLRLGDATKEAGFMWMGMTSAISSSIDMMRKAMGEGIFDVLKGRMRGALFKGGFLDPGGETIEKLNEAARFLGDHLGRAAAYLFDRFEAATRYFADNWESVFTDLRDWSERFGRIVKLMLAGAAARTGFGAAVGLGGVATSGIGQVVSLVSTLGATSLIAAPAIFLVGAALTGVAALFGGAAAFIVENFDELIASFNTGAITFGPFLDALDLLWAKFVALGGAMFGTSDATGAANTMIFMMTDSVHALIAVFGLGLKVLGGFQFVFNAVLFGFKAIGLAFVSLVGGILTMVKSAITSTVGEAFVPAGLQSAISTLGATTEGLFKSMDKDATDATRAWKLADTFMDAAADPGKGPLRMMAEKAKKKLTDLGSETAGKGPLAKPTNVTHIHKLIVHQDLRNSDPDRVIGAFYKAVDRSVEKRTQALSLVPEGI